MCLNVCILFYKRNKNKNKVLKKRKRKILKLKIVNKTKQNKTPGLDTITDELILGRNNINCIQTIPES